MSKILVIEDEAAIRRVLVKILSEESDKYQLDEAEDGLIGIEKIRKDDYDLVLCDIKMPKMDGVEVLEAIKKLKPEIPIVMISGHGDIDTAVNTMRLGAFDYISKPPDLNRLLNTVRNALDRKELVAIRMRCCRRSYHRGVSLHSCRLRRSPLSAQASGDLTGRRKSRGSLHTLSLRAFPVLPTRTAISRSNRPNWQTTWPASFRR